MTARRWPLEPLAALMGGMGAMTRMGFDNGELYRAKRAGMTERQADRWAVRCGLHPSLVWPDFIEEPTDRRRRLNRESERRRYQENPAKRARRLATRRAYYAENATYERAQARRRYAAKTA